MKKNKRAKELKNTKLKELKKILKKLKELKKILKKLKELKKIELEKYYFSKNN